MRVGIASTESDRRAGDLHLCSRSAEDEEIAVATRWPRRASDVGDHARGLAPPRAAH